MCIEWYCENFNAIIVVALVWVVKGLVAPPSDITALGHYVFSSKYLETIRATMQYQNINFMMGTKTSEFYIFIYTMVHYVHK